MDPGPENELGKLAETSRPTLLGDFCYFLWHDKKWWLAPLLLIFLLLALLMLLSTTGAAPFIYSLF